MKAPPEAPQSKSGGSGCLGALLGFVGGGIGGCALVGGLVPDRHHNDWGPVLDMSSYERKVEIYTREWNLPDHPVAKYYRFDFLKQALRELKLLRSWDPSLDAMDAKLRAAVA